MLAKGRTNERLKNKPSTKPSFYPLLIDNMTAAVKKIRLHSCPCLFTIKLLLFVVWLTPHHRWIYMAFVFNNDIK